MGAQRRMQKPSHFGGKSQPVEEIMPLRKWGTGPLEAKRRVRGPRETCGGPMEPLSPAR